MPNRNYVVCPYTSSHFFNASVITRILLISLSFSLIVAIRCWGVIPSISPKMRRIRSMQAGIIETRGNDIFEDGIKQAKFKLEEKRLITSQNEIKEAITDLSRRPIPEITGSIQHSLAALECVCREVAKDKKATLGTLINNHPNIVPKPLDDAIKKSGGFHQNKGDTFKKEEILLMKRLSF